MVQLQQRTWLIHWSLFVFFNDPKGRGRDGITDMFLNQPQYANAIQTVCPHILRYLTAAVITNKRRKNVLKDLVKIIQQVLLYFIILYVYVTALFDYIMIMMRKKYGESFSDGFITNCYS